MEAITINFSKRKLVSLILYSNLFLVIGLIFILKRSEIASRIPKLDNQNLNIALGVFALIVWIVSILHLIKTYFSKKPGLIIDQNGITNNSSAFPTKFFSWNEIDSVEIRNQKLPILPSQKYLNIKFKNPNRAPKDISTNALETSLEELLENVREFLNNKS